jgi:hypothetical protein
MRAQEPAGGPDPSGHRRFSSRALLAAGLLVSLLLAGVVSFYASSHPDGLEYVAQQTGFIDSATDHAAVDSPIADYTTRGVDDARLSRGIAGVSGALLVLTLAGGLFLVLRRRDDDGAGVPTSERLSDSER